MTSKFREALDMIKEPIFQIYTRDNTLSIHINCSYKKACKNIETIRQALLIAERLESGEVSPKMATVGIINEQGTIDAFCSMAKVMIEEVGKQ